MRLTDLHGRHHSPDAAADFAYSQFHNDYPSELLSDIAHKFRQAMPETSTADKFLGLTHLRAAHSRIAEITTLMHDAARLDALSAIAGTRLEPYPLTRAGSHINIYGQGHASIGAHTDGPAFVELIPLEISDDCAGGETMIARESPSHASALGADSEVAAAVSVTQVVGQSVLMQGRMLRHWVNPVRKGYRITLVFALQAADEPWKDNNTLFRLLLDDEFDDVVGEWCTEQQRRANLYKARFLTKR